ncbi:sugar phosphate isomerase/epimerase [Thermoactinomyces sp. CICC 10522]|uniref:sugar phosphate isomerase/epimerase family protein n=1 Tax=Thermoactinomyces sp. CICC 10522 TaxID=2767427 RepID=UPI0018DD6DC9|nr:sugar phosphate isomerase/epimerase family protein [Thermoactinomyces sp. CICC 10522]MBH8605629.1 sugar phosphate isomerase/epimerase [Thermoactinomyces sp. CICC 10522]
MKFSLMTYSLVPLMRTGEMKLEDVVRFAADEGFEAIELLMFDFSRPAGEITGLLDKYGMKISCIDAFVDLAAGKEDVYAENIALGKRIVDQAEELSAPMVMLVPAFADQIQSEAEKLSVLPKIIQALQEITAYAQSKQITVTIENYPDLRVPFCSLAEIETILRQVPGLKLTLDCGNMLVAGDDPLKACERLGKVMVNAHLKDWQVTADESGTLCADGRYLKPAVHGQGIIDYRSLFRKMLEQGYDGYLAFEYEGEHNCKEAARQGIRYLRTELNRLLNSRG